MTNSERLEFYKKQRNKALFDRKQFNFSVNKNSLKYCCQCNIDFADVVPNENGSKVILTP